MCICEGSAERKLEEARSNAIYRACILGAKRSEGRKNCACERGEYADEASKR